MKKTFSNVFMYIYTGIYYINCQNISRLQKMQLSINITLLWACMCVTKNKK